MSTLFSAVAQNLSFVAISAAIVIVLGLAARLLERKCIDVRHITPARRVSIISICAAIAAILHMLDFPLLLIAPGFYKLDFSEVPVMLSGFFLGPSAAVACEGVKILLKLLFKSTSTAFVGDLANFAVGCSFILPATIIYHTHKSKHSAIVGLAVGTLCMTVFGSAFNAVYLLPKFSQLYGLPMDVLLNMGTQIHSSINNVWNFAALCVAPLNLIKGTAVSFLTMALYKRVAGPLFHAHEKPLSIESANH